jgi:peptidylprolyl isomerase
MSPTKPLLGLALLALGFSLPQSGDPFQRHQRGYKVACNDDATLRPSDAELWARAKDVELTMSEAVDEAVRFAKEEQHFPEVKVLSAELALQGKPYYYVELLTQRDGVANRWQIHVGLKTKKVKFWLIQNRLPGVPIPPEKELTSLPSGVAYCDVREGDGAIVDPQSIVKVHYLMFTLGDDLPILDTYAHGAPEEFAISNTPIPGLGQGLIGARVGTKRKLVIPGLLAYGVDGVPGQIPRNATVVYDVEIKDVQKGESQGPAPSSGQSGK